MAGDEKLVNVLRAVQRLDEEKAPKQHRLQTPQCPSLPRLAAGVQGGWTPEERAHVAACPYCQMLLSADEPLPGEEEETGPPSADAGTGVVGSPRRPTAS
jgi:hypothetical protein